MKTLFSTGLPNQNMFWMGQIAAGTKYNIDDLMAKLNTADTQYNSAVMLKNNPNYRTILGSDADRFDQMMKGIGDIYDDLTIAEQVVNSRQVDSITQTQAQEMQDYIAVSAELAKIVAAHPVSAAATAARGVPAPAPASSSTTPLLIGGAVVGAVLLGVLLFK